VSYQQLRKITQIAEKQMLILEVHTLRQ